MSLIEVRHIPELIFVSITGGASIAGLVFVCILLNNENKENPYLPKIWFPIQPLIGDYETNIQVKGKCYRKQDRFSYYSLLTKYLIASIILALAPLAFLIYALNSELFHQGWATWVMPK